MPEDGSAEDPRFIAGIELLKKGGAEEVQIRYSDDEKPVVWMCVVRMRNGVHEAAGGMTPLVAMTRLCEETFDGGLCAHCGKPCGINPDWKDQEKLDRLVDDAVCWHTYDPETQKFRRGCEGETTDRAYGVDREGNTVGRNDPCPCGSGKKWKKCHGEKS